MKSLLNPNPLPLIPSLSSLQPLAHAIDPQLSQIAQCSNEELILSRIDELPEQTLDILAWQLHCDFYDLAYSLDIKCRTVKGSLLWHMKKGTVAAIIEALNLIDIDAKFIHWKDIPDAKPYTFNITAIVAGDFYRTRGKDRLASSIRRAVYEAKAERSLMAKLDIRIEPKESISLYSSALWVRNWDINLGLEQSIMHELLILFEKRIIDKLASYAQLFSEKMDSFSLDLTRKLQDSERNIYSRVDSTVEDIARRISSCEAQTARLIADCEASTSARIQSNILRMEQYEIHIANYFEEIQRQIQEVKACLEWLGVELDEAETELNGPQKGFDVRA